MSFANGPFSTEMPLDLAFGLAMDQARMKETEQMTEYEKEKLIAESKNVKGKEEMEDLMQKIEEGDHVII